MSTNRSSRRILVTIPHYCTRDSDNFNKSKEIRSMSLARSVSSYAQQAGHGQVYLNFTDKRASYANHAGQQRCDIYICTTAGEHLLDDLDILKGFYHHVETDAHPRLLGYTCREVLRSFLGKYDYYCYVEDDLFLNDPLFFDKLAWFSSVAGQDSLLQPNRCEVSFNNYAQKCYIDGDIPPENNPYFKPDPPLHSFQAMGMRLEFVAATNPHSGCYFLNAEQFEYWTRQPDFNNWDMSWVGPLESAASLGIMKAFKIYKPAWHNASFLEINHFGDAYLQMIGTDFDPPENYADAKLNPMGLTPLKHVSATPERTPITFTTGAGWK